MKKFIKLVYIFTFLIYSYSSFLFSQDISAGFDDPELKVKIVKIIFEGPQPFEEDDINALIKTSKGEFFSQSELGLDALRITKFYFDNGYFDTDVDTSTAILPDKKELNVTFKIIPGDVYKIYSTNFSGLENIPQNVHDEIYNRRNMMINITDDYNKSKIDSEVVRILNILLNNGYAFARRDEVEVVKNLSENTMLENTVDVNLSFTTGKQYYFGTTDVVIKENKYNIPESDFERELQYKPGELYNREKIIKTESKIASITLIETNSLVIKNIDSADRVINYNLEITLRNKYEVVPEVVGYAIQSRFYAGLGVSYTNRYFFNTNRTFGARVRGLMNSFDDIRIEFLSQVSQPYLFNNERMTGNLGVGFDYWKESDLEIQQYRAKFGILYELPYYTYINRALLNWTFEFTDIALPLSMFVPESEIEDLILGFNYFNSRIGIDAIHDNTNSLSFPTHGFYQAVSFEETGLMGTVLEQLFTFNTYKFIKLINLNKFFFNLSDQIHSKSALGVKGLLGNIFPYGSQTFIINGEEFPDQDVPDEDKFTAGGANSNRGWRARTLGMLRIPEKGGNFIFDGSVEHRLRPFIESSNFILKDIGFVTFIDFGNVWETASKFKLDNIAISMGAGIRYYTLVGAIRLDVGFKVYDPRPGHVGVTNWIWQNGANFKDKYSIHIALGNSF